MSTSKALLLGTTVLLSVTLLGGCGAPKNGAGDKVESVAKPASSASTASAAAPAKEVAVDPRDVPQPKDGRHAVTLPSAPESAMVGKPFKSIGYLGPQHIAGTKPVRIYLFERSAAGEWEYQFWTQAKVENFDTYSKYVANVKVPRPGQWRLQAVAPADAEHKVFRSGFADVEVTK